MPQFIDGATRAVLGKLYDGRVLSVRDDGDGEVTFIEECDHLFGVALSAEETKLFANYLLNLVGDK